MDVGNLFGALRPIPVLVGALCRGQPFDRLSDADAAAICHRCPALAACAAWADAQPANTLTGVIAGRWYRTVGYAGERHQPDGQPVTPTRNRTRRHTNAPGA